MAPLMSQLSDVEILKQTLNVLQEQLEKAKSDYSQLLIIKARAMDDPLKFVESIKNKKNFQVPKMQKVLKIHKINWKNYKFKENSIPEELLDESIRSEKCFTNALEMSANKYIDGDSEQESRKRYLDNIRDALGNWKNEDFKACQLKTSNYTNSNGVKTRVSGTFYASKPISSNVKMPESDTEEIEKFKKRTKFLEKDEFLQDIIGISDSYIKDTKEYQELMELSRIWQASQSSIPSPNCSIGTKFH